MSNGSRLEGGIVGVVTGGRNYDNAPFLWATLDRILKKKGVRLLVHGGATGADALADEWACMRGVKGQEGAGRLLVAP